jgi:hypothetical protein
MAKPQARGDNFRDTIMFVRGIPFLAFKSQVGLRRCSMKTAFVISAAALIAIGAAVFSSTKANAEDNEGGGVARFIRPAPVPPSAAPPERAYYHRPYHRRHSYHHHRRYN